MDASWRSNDFYMVTWGKGCSLISGLSLQAVKPAGPDGIRWRAPQL